MTAWTVPRLWPGETVFIFAGGPSLATQGTERLAPQEGGPVRRCIAVNSSYVAHPWADYLFAADDRWLDLPAQRKALPGLWSGRAVTVARRVRWDGLLELKKMKGPGLSADPRAVGVDRTSLRAAINLAVHLGGARLVLLGADNRRSKDGRTHHHKPHSWLMKPEDFGKQYRELTEIVEPLEALGIEVLNASPGSRLDFWPITTLDEVLATTSEEAAA